MEQKSNGEFLLDCLDHGLAVERQVAELVAVTRGLLRNLEDRDDLPAPESEVPVIPPLCRRCRPVALDARALNLALVSLPHVHPPGEKSEAQEQPHCDDDYGAAIRFRHKSVS